MSKTYRTYKIKTKCLAAAGPAQAQPKPGPSPGPRGPGPARARVWVWAGLGPGRAGCRLVSCCIYLVIHMEDFSQSIHLFASIFLGRRLLDYRVFKKQGYTYSMGLFRILMYPKQKKNSPIMYRAARFMSACSVCFVRCNSQTC